MKNLLSILLSGVILLSVTSCSTTQSTTPNYDINRLSTEIEAFEEFDKRARYQPDAVLFTGSSSIRFWSSLNNDMDPVPAINRGFGGSTFPEVLHYYDRIITKFRPSILVLYCGENDIWMGRSVNDVVADYKAFVRKTKKVLPETKIVYLAMKPSPARWEKWKMYVEGNKKISAIINNDDDQFYVEVSEKMLGDNGQPLKDIFVEDMLHMNSKGYVGWTELIQPVIHELYKN